MRPYFNDITSEQVVRNRRRQHLGHLPQHIERQAFCDIDKRHNEKRSSGLHLATAVDAMGTMLRDRFECRR